MDKTHLGLLILFACTDTVTCGEYCFTAIYSNEYCPYYCCDSSYSYYDYCCTTKPFTYWIIAPIVIGVVIFIAVIVTVCVCCCKTVNGMTRYQSWTGRRVGGTTIAMATSVNQQSTMNNYAYPQQYTGYPPTYQQPYPMGQQPYVPGQQPYPTGQQPYAPGPQFGGPQPPMNGGTQPPMQPGGSQTSVPPPYSVSYGQGFSDPSFPPKS